MSNKQFRVWRTPERRLPRKSVQIEKRRGLKTDPWGILILKGREEEEESTKKTEKKRLE